MTRRIIAAVALLAAWGCYYLAAEAWLRSENERCERFGDLAAECFAPQAVAAFWIGAVLVFSTLILTWFAIRQPSRPESN
ncbi:hypothetical protein OF829_17650 [Sphingomonas sp. LB-2]|uniref:hypothetical protein n=1 Tax=Sphingomonas caeni TaxID=2984949 RepID=UPI00222EB857|nr:hypothetical protein [Sphingomonas caeni]MCW3849067.1 hypothetical protein [Sphingomonas caeni]